MFGAAMLKPTRSRKSSARRRGSRKRAVEAVRATAVTASAARKARSLDRREAILAAALDEFSSRGFEAARLDDVARRAGVAKGTIYLYFDDKEALFREIVTTMLVPLVAVLEAPPPDLPVRDVITRFMELFVREIYSTERRNVLRLVMTEGQRFPELAEFHYRNVVERALAAMRALLARARERGELKDDTLVRFPQLIVAPGMVAIVWSGLFDRFAPLDVDAMMRAHVATLFEGAAP
jgi:AcrR family transcriptional regulator